MTLVYSRQCVLECMYQMHVLSCICGIFILPFSTIFQLDFGIVLTVCYFDNFISFQILEYVQLYLLEFKEIGLF